MIDALTKLLDQMADHGASSFYAKRLASNDNSRNQVYLSGDFGALNIIPHGPIEEDDDSRAGSVQERMKAKVNFLWIDDVGLSPAPDTKLILYPRYPEVRMSGFLRGTERAPSKLMQSRHEGRLLFLGVCPDGRVIGKVVENDTPEAKALNAPSVNRQSSGVFIDLQVFRYGGTDPRQVLLSKLRHIHKKGWIPSKKLGNNGVPIPYNAQNGGGYTLEAEFGISPNANAEPDYLGWEVKQYSVSDFVNYVAKSPVTLMTPEPTGGIYKAQGPEIFLQRYGYVAQSGQLDRINFGGIYANNKDFHPINGLALRLYGFNHETGNIIDMDGAINLIDNQDVIAASWGFRSMFEHWNRKHAKAVYIPSMRRAPPPEYKYGNVVQLCEGTDILLLLRALSSGVIYYDPGIKMEIAGINNPKIKKRSQFRVKHINLKKLYVEYNDVEINTMHN